MHPSFQSSEQIPNITEIKSPTDNNHDNNSTKLEKWHEIHKRNQFNNFDVNNLRLLFERIAFGGRVAFHLSG